MNEPEPFDLVTIPLNKEIDVNDKFARYPSSGITISGLNSNIEVLVPVFFFGFATELEIIFIN